MYFRGILKLCSCVLHIFLIFCKNDLHEHKGTHLELSSISDFHHILNENFALPKCYVFYINSYLPTFRDNQSALSLKSNQLSYVSTQPNFPICSSRILHLVYLTLDEKIIPQRR
jgi:hypothetical protein